MRRHRVMLVLAGAAAVGCAAPLTVTAAPTAWAAARASAWGTAIEVPGLGSLNQGGLAEVASVSCGSAGNCLAVGGYRDGANHEQAFVAGEGNGTWRRAIEVPGSGTLNAGGGASADSVSCVSAGNCAAVGTYTDASGSSQVFVVSKTNGIWGNPIEVPGFATLNKHGPVGPNSVSCASAGNCAAVGGYLDGSLRLQVFVASERNGIWGNAIEVPGTASLNAGGDAAVFSVSCRSAGNCAAGGDYKDGAGHTQAFVVSETNGTWGRAIEVPGSGALNSGGDASVGSVSCVSAGNCVAVGGYKDGAGHDQAFVVRETNGTWGSAIEVPGSGALNSGGLAYAESVSCTVAGYCAVGGSYTDGGGQEQAFVASETNGTWRNAIEIPGSGALPAGRFGSNTLVSCATAGNCAAGLTYTAETSPRQAFVASETNGTWGNAIVIPGLSTLNTGENAAITSVSCGSAGNCAAVGTYTDGSGHSQAFVVNQG
jgi:hypothetical protein